MVKCSSPARVGGEVASTHLHSSILDALVRKIQWNLSPLSPVNNSRGKIFSFSALLRLVFSWCVSKWSRGWTKPQSSCYHLGIFLHICPHGVHQDQSGLGIFFKKSETKCLHIRLWQKCTSAKAWHILSNEVTKAQRKYICCFLSTWTITLPPSPHESQNLVALFYLNQILNLAPARQCWPLTVFCSCPENLNTKHQHQILPTPHVTSIRWVFIFGLISNHAPFKSTGLSD